MSIEVQGHFFTIFFQVLYVLCFTRPRYQVSVYRTIGPLVCICENKDADQLRDNREVDQRPCFRYIASTIPLLPKYKISSVWISSVAVQPGLCETWSETLKTGFLTTRLIFRWSLWHFYSFWTELLHTA